MMLVLPTLQKRIRSAFIRLLMLFGGLWLVLVTGLFVAGRMPTLLVRMNYDSIVYARLMEESVNALWNAEHYSERDAEGWKTQFRSAYALEQGNLTENDEHVAVENIGTAWEAFLQGPDDNSYLLLRKAVATLVQVNEQGMLKRLDENANIRDLSLLGASLVFVLGTVWAFFLADGIATRLVHPLRRAAEIFRAGPALNQRLHLPLPQTLEVRILFDELSRIWGRLAELDALNVEKVLAEKQKLEVILESAEDAVLVLDAADTVVLVSKRMLLLLGLKQYAVLGQPWGDLSSLSDNYLALRESLRNNLQGSQTLVLRVDDDEEHFKVRRRNLVGAHDHVAGQVFLLSDITEKKRRDALRSEMMDWISHELKTPMQSLGLAADLMVRHQGLDGETRLLAETIQQDATRLRIVARQFMDVARMSPQALQLRLEQTDLAQIIGPWLTPFHLVARESGIKLALEATPGMVVNLDVERFAWVVSNLVSNALRVCPMGAEITVSVSAAGTVSAAGAVSAGRVEETEAFANNAGESTVLLQVADNGPGISPELEAHLFKPFSHGRSAGTRDGLVGLGLAITQSIVEAHGGDITYARRPEGGSLFTVMLPGKR